MSHERWSSLACEVAAEFGDLSGLSVWRDMEAARGPGRRRAKAVRRQARRCQQCRTRFTPIGRRGPVSAFCSTACYKRGHGARTYRTVKRDPEEYQVHLLAARSCQEQQRRAAGAVPWSQRKLPVAASYGAWVVIGEVLERPGRERLVLCRCACGNEKPVRFSHLRSGRSARCSRCSSRDKCARLVASARVVTHEQRRTHGAKEQSHG